MMGAGDSGGPGDWRVAEASRSGCWAVTEVVAMVGYIGVRLTRKARPRDVEMSRCRELSRVATEPSCRLEIHRAASPQGASISARLARVESAAGAGRERERKIARSPGRAAASS